MIGLLPTQWRWLSIAILGILLFVAPQSARAAASLSVSPTAGAYEVGSLVDVSFLLDTGGEAVNAVNADILFPADKLQVVNPAASTSFISIWVTAPTYSNTNGTITFQGGLPNPGIKTSGGVISTVTFRIISTGKASITYAPTSKVLRNDGEGTNILTSSGRAEFQLKNPPPAGPIVTSVTHGDSNQWYNNPSIQFEWEPTAKATGYSFSFDQTAKQIPDETIDTTNTAANVRATGDGIWYFHVRAKTETWGGVTTFPVRIDITAPAAFVPSADQTTMTTEDTNTLRFITTDSASGIDHYEVKQVNKKGGGDTLFVESTSPYVITRQPAGEYEFIVRALDRAGNVTEGSLEITVIAGGLPFYARVPLLQNPAVANATLFALGLLVIITTTVIIIRRVRIRATFRHDLVALEHDAQKKSAALQHELEELQRAQEMFRQDLPPPPSVPPSQTPTT